MNKKLNNGIDFINMNQLMKYGCILLYATLFLSCSDVKKGNEKNTLEHKKSIESAIRDYSRVELYCWCLNSIRTLNNDKEDSSLLSLCTTTISIKPRQLISPEYFSDFTTSRDTVNLISATLFSGVELKHTDSQNTDARLVLVLDNNKTQPDIFVYKNRFEMLFNATVTYKYTFPIIDSILHLMGKESLICPQ